MSRTVTNTVYNSTFIIFTIHYLNTIGKFIGKFWKLLFEPGHVNLKYSSKNDFYRCKVKDHFRQIKTSGL